MERVCAGDVLAVSRAITAIENHQPEAGGVAACGVAAHG